MRKTNSGDATLCVHAGEERRGRAGSLTTDIALSSVFVFPTLDHLRRYNAGDPSLYMYTRYANPTTRAAEEKLAALEGGEDCIVTASGMAAIAAAVLSVCRAGDEIVSMLDVYGGTLKLFETVLSRAGIRTRFVPFDHIHHVERYFTRRTRVLFLESPTNPTLRCVDLARLAAAARRRKLCVIVDSTFATPVLQKPLALGADMVVHSGTKYLGGHSDLTAGALVGAKRWIEPARQITKLLGATLDPHASYLLIRGLKTLELRVRRASENAARIAAWLTAHPRVQRVWYPGLPDNLGYEVARRQMAAFGPMLSFDILGAGRAAERFIDSLRLWCLAPSLGGVESTVSYPLLTSHQGLSRQRLKQLQVSPATVRLSVGIERAEDLLADLEQALGQV